MAKGWQMRETAYKNFIRRQRERLRESIEAGLWQSKRIDQYQASIKALVKRKRATEHIGELIRPERGKM